MSSNADFIQNWNEIFQYKIKETDLLTPNEQFLTNVLLNYLEKFNMDLSLLLNVKDNEIAENRRKFKIQLCDYIDHIYKSGNEASNTFLYYDLISPSQKKTVHLLKYLLNYLFFYNVMKEDIIQPTEDQIHQRCELLEKKSKLLIEKEKNEILEKHIEKTVDSYKNKLPKLNEKLKKLEIKESKLNAEKNCLEIVLKEQKSKLIQLKQEERNKLCNIVSDEEHENLLSKKENLEKLLFTQMENEKLIKSSDRERTISIVELESFILKIEKFMNIVKLDDITTFKELKQACHELDEKIREQKKTNDVKITLTEKDINIVENLSAVLNKNTESLKNFQQLYDEEILNIEKDYEAEQLNEIKLNTERIDLIADLKEQQEITDTMASTAKQFYKHLTRSFREN